ncbi:hypothetical protein SAMN02745244_00143 [Tessaracoccus bendigoensis DSM 12906]|uniref:Uncharacterized protein n=2 Tax=Tessaracoccus TaxID=72763 RepID=A0A1M6AC21_9ACTN|nr:hypothetical protein SAMN02745244_00143 [Tessaracoccus bendigoensis DSM 12906]
MTAEQLLAGPRGRRLLLGLALESDRTCDDGPGPLWSAVFDASFLIAQSQCHSVSRFGWGDLTPKHTEFDVAEALSALTLAPVTDARLFDALQRSVDAAMYWQEPDGDDLLCAIPQVSQALIRVARHAASAPIPGWWSEPVARDDQWEVAWAEAPLQQDGELLTWREEVVRAEVEARVNLPADITANASGCWWSRPPHWLTSSTRTTSDGVPVGMRLVEDGLGWSEATVHKLAVPDHARVYEVDTPDAWARLCRDFPLEVTAQHRHDWYRTTRRDGDWVIPDWSAVAGSWSGIHLTVAAYVEAATTAIPVTGRLSSVIAGCDPDTTWWFPGVVTRTGEQRPIALPAD